MNNWWTKYQVDVPLGNSGDVVIDQFEVSAEDAKWSAVRAVLSFSSAGRSVPEGTYTALRFNGEIVMSDTPSEISDLLDAFRDATGRVLVTGLGLGVALNGFLRKPNVEHVTVVEVNQKVIELVGGHWRDRYGDRLEIIHDDAFEYRPAAGVRFNYAWHDIWNAICGDNVEEMKRLHRQFGRRCDQQASWCRRQCEQSR